MSISQNNILEPSASSQNNKSNHVFLNMLPLWLLIALTALDFLSHIPLGGDYSNRLADSVLLQSNHSITNAIFYAIGIWALAKLIIHPIRLRVFLQPVMLCFLSYCCVVALSLAFMWPFKLPSWDASQTYSVTMVIRLFAFFLAIAAMHTSIRTLNPIKHIKTLWNILLGFFTFRLCIVWIQNLQLKFPINTANPSTETQIFVSKQLELLFDGRLFYPIRAKGLEFPFLYGPLNANESATMAIILFCTALIRLLNLRKNDANTFHVLIWIFVSVLSIITIIFTSSTTALILLVIAIPLILTINKRGDVVAITLFLIAAFALAFDEPIQNKFASYFGRGESALQRVTDLGGRSYIWKKALSHVKEKPIFGHGYETNRFVIGRPLKDVAPYNNPDVLHAHNTYISVLVENGIVGLIPIALAVLLLWFSCIKKLRQSKFDSLSQEMFLLLLIVSFSSLIYIGFFNSVLIIYRWLMLIPLLLYVLSPTTSITNTRTKTVEADLE